MSNVKIEMVRKWCKVRIPTTYLGKYILILSDPHIPTVVRICSSVATVAV